MNLLQNPRFARKIKAIQHSDFIIQNSEFRTEFGMREESVCITILLAMNRLHNITPQFSTVALAISSPDFMGLHIWIFSGFWKIIQSRERRTM